MVVKGNVRGAVMSVHLLVRIHASRVVVMLVKHLVTQAAKKHAIKRVWEGVPLAVVEYVLECVTVVALVVVLMLQNNMKKFFVITLWSILVCLNIAGQENYVLETRYRNPIDTTSFHSKSTLLLFVHSKCDNSQCATCRMQKALKRDSLNIRKEREIKLYVIYSNYNKCDLEMFDSYMPVLAEIAFYTDTKYKGAFSDENSTPFVVLYDGKGNTFTRLGGTYEDLCEFIKRKVSSGTGLVQ